MSENKEGDTFSNRVKGLLAVLSAIVVIVTPLMFFSDRVTQLESDFDNHILSINDRLALLNENNGLSLKAEIDVASEKLLTLKDKLDEAIAELKQIEDKLNEVDKQAAINASKLAYINRLSTELPDKFKSEIAALNDEDKILLADQVFEIVRSEGSIVETSDLLSSNEVVDADTFKAIINTAKSREDDCNTIEDAMRIECQAEPVPLYE